MSYDPNGPAPQYPDPQAINGVPYDQVKSWEQAQYEQAANANRAGQQKATGNMTIKTTSRPTPGIIRAPKKGK